MFRLRDSHFDILVERLPTFILLKRIQLTNEKAKVLGYDCVYNTENRILYKRGQNEIHDRRQARHRVIISNSKCQRPKFQKNESIQIPRDLILSEKNEIVKKK